MNEPIIILIIDDDLKELYLFSKAIREVNPQIRCITKESGREAIRALKLMKIPIPSMIYLDCHMPDLNGKECLLAIKKIKRFSSIPIILQSTWRDSDEELELMNLGASLYVQKPTEFKSTCNLVLSCIHLFYRVFNSPQREV